MVCVRLRRSGTCSGRASHRLSWKQRRPLRISLATPRVAGHLRRYARLCQRWQGAARLPGGNRGSVSQCRHSVPLLVHSHFHTSVGFYLLARPWTVPRPPRTGSIRMTSSIHCDACRQISARARRRGLPVSDATGRAGTLRDEAQHIKK